MESDEEAVPLADRSRTLLAADHKTAPGSVVRKRLLSGLGVFLLAALLFLAPRPRTWAGSEAHHIGLWNEALAKAKLQQKEKASCGLYGCGKIIVASSCACHPECKMDGTCCADFDDVCKVKGQDKPKAEGRLCKDIGCSNTYLFDHECQCTPSCLDFDDCCSDFKSHCAANLTRSLEVAPRKDQEPQVEASVVVSFKQKVPKDAKEKHEAFLKEHAHRVQLLQWQAVKSCPPQFLDQTYMDGRQLAKLAKISTAAHCQKACTENLQCDAFVWAASGTCLLASLDGAAPMMMAQEGLIAGQPCCRGAREGKVLTDCPEQMADTELRTSADLQQLHADDAFKCQEACTKEHECGAFSWSPKGCVLKRLAPDESPRMIPKDGVISGLPCGCRATAANAMWPHRDAEKFTMPLPRGNKPTKPGSLLCLALMVPYSYETGLIVMQYKHHAGIFACDEYQVYSNQAMVLAPGLETRKVLSSQECEVGGEFKSALNLQIFTAFWRQVISDGHYLLYNWVIKADPDTVFFADRLRPILQKHQDGNSLGIVFTVQASLNVADAASTACSM